MLKKILVPLDGSALADRMLVHVRRILLREDAEVTLLRVLPGDPNVLDEGRRRLLLDEANGHLEREWKRLDAQGARVRFELMNGDPALQILRFAETLQPSLIAMSTHGRSGLDRWVRGSVAERVLRFSPFPVMMANVRVLADESGAPEARFRKILVPLDGSKVSAEVLPMVEHLGHLYESEILLLHAATAYPSFSEYPWVDLNPPEGEINAMLEPYREALDKAHLPSRIRISFEHPASAILDAAAQEKVDLIAMTTHGRSGISRWVFGSVAEKVLRQGPCPILLHRIGGVTRDWLDLETAEGGTEKRKMA